MDDDFVRIMKEVDQTSLEFDSMQEQSQSESVQEFMSSRIKEKHTDGSLEYHE